MYISYTNKIRLNQVPLPTQDTTWENDTNMIKHNIHEGQEVNPFQAGVHKAAMNRQESITNTKHNKNDPQKKHRLGTVSTKLFQLLHYLLIVGQICEKIVHFMIKA